jgi:hypothetical protein
VHFDCPGPAPHESFCTLFEDHPGACRTLTARRAEQLEEAFAEQRDGPSTADLNTPEHLVVDETGMLPCE